MLASLVRRQLGGIIPPKIATPSLLVRSLVLPLLHFHELFSQDLGLWCKPHASGQLLLKIAQGFSSRCFWWRIKG